MASQRPPDAFLSYTRFDDQHDGGAISEFCRRLADAVRAVTGEPFEIFQDVDGIGLGERWRGKLDRMLDEARFFIPIVTPSYFTSKACRDELEKFLRAEADRQRDDLVLPIYYIESDVLEDDERRTGDPLAKTIHERQRQDWRQLRFEPFEAREVRKELERLAREIVRARRRSVPPPTQVVRKQAPTSSRPREPAALGSGVAPDRPSLAVAPNDTDAFLSQPIYHDTLADYTTRKYPNLPLSKKVHELLLSDLAHSRFVTLRDVDRAVDAATDAVECCRKENPGVFNTGTDFITKSLGLVDKDFRAKHRFSERTREAFSKCERLVRSDGAREAAKDQEVIDYPPKEAAGEPAPGRKPEPRGPSLRHPTIVAAVIGAIGAVAAALAAALSPWLLEQISDGNGEPIQEAQELQKAKRVEATSPEATTELAPVATTAEVPHIGEELRDCESCPPMVLVPAGEPGRDDDEGPQHKVTIAQPFWVGKYEVTFAEWDACHADRGCGHKPKDEWGRGDQPVMRVSWHDAQEYVAWLGRKTGNSYRLLSEAEWEYVARAGTTTAYWWGKDVGSGNANCAGCGSEWGNKSTAPVNSFKANDFGLHNTAGNVWEWVQDCYHNSYDGAPKDGSAWKDGDDCLRVLRGGSWNVVPRYVRSADRNRLNPDDRFDFLGFRVARAPD